MFSGNHMPALAPFTANNFLTNPVSAQNHINTHSSGDHALSFQYSNQTNVHFNVDHNPMASGPVDIAAKLEEHERRIKQLMDENAALQANYARMAVELGTMRAQESRHNTANSSYDNSEGSLSGASTSASGILSETSFDGQSLSEMSFDSQGLSHAGLGIESEMEDLATFIGMSCCKLSSLCGISYSLSVQRIDGQYGPPDTNSVPLNLSEVSLHQSCTWTSKRLSSRYLHDHRTFSILSGWI